MFKRLLFGNEAKLQFKTSTSDGIARLYSEGNISSNDVRYWRKFLICFDSANDVFTLMSISDIRKALIRHPENIETLVTILINHLETLKEDPLLSPIPSAQSSSSSSIYATASRSTIRLTDQASSSALSLVDAGARSAAALGSFWGGRNDGSTSTTHTDQAPEQTRDRTKEALNCCRILTRLLPIIMEGDHDSTSNVQADGGLDPSAALDTDEFEQQLLWTEQPANAEYTADLWGNATSQKAAQKSFEPSASPDESQENQFVIEESDEEDEEAGNSSVRERAPSDPLRSQTKERNASQSETDMKPSLGERLTRATVDFLFYSGFSIPWSEEQIQASSDNKVSTTRVQYVISEKGIGSSVDIAGRTKTHINHRLEVLRLLLVLLSKNIYVMPSRQKSTENYALRILVTKLEKSIVLPLLCTLLNVSIASSKKDNWLGNLTSLPADLVKERLAGGEDGRPVTMTIALQLLNIVLGYEAPTKDESDQTDQSGMGTPMIPGTPRPGLTPKLSQLSVSSFRSKDVQTNTFRLYLSKLHRQSDFHVLADGIFAIIAQRPSPAALLNGNAAGQVMDTSAAGPHIPETILVLWRLLWHNAKFRTFLLEDRSPQLMAHLLFHALNNKDSAARQGLVRLVVFILHDISCDRAFAVNICKAGSGAKAKITGSQRWGVAVGGGSTVAAGGTTANQSSQSSTGADILIQAIYALIATTKSSLSALYAPMIITLTNVSPYFKNLSILSSNKLMALFGSFANPTFLLADEGNPRVLYFLIEALNNIVQHGFQRNPNVAYAIVRNHQTIERLANFTLRRGIAEVRRSRRRGGLLGNIITSPRSEFPPSSPHQTSEVASPRTSGEKQNDTSGEEVRNEAEQAPSSEKARGKMRQTSTDQNTAYAAAMQEDEEDELVNGFNDDELHLAAGMLGRNGFVPTQAWVSSWHKGLPLDVLQITIVELVPKVEELCGRIGSKSNADERVLALLREQNLDDVLPNKVTGKAQDGTDLTKTPQPRPFRWTSHVSIWLLSYLWGLIYVTSSMPYGLFNGSCARLFQLRIQDKGPAARLVPSTPSSPSEGGQGGNRRRLNENATGDQSGLAGVGNMVLGNLTGVFGLGLSQSNPSQVRQNTAAPDRGGTV